jgi:glycosyltransferase involved in cell wall biosynthesis
MDWSSQCAVVIPCFNEGRTIETVVQEVRQILPAVIVVDDGSRDATVQRAERAGARVVRHPANQGKGTALGSGLRRARELGFAWAVIMDGDGQHAPSDVPLLLQRAATTGAALVIGNRMHDPSRMPWLRRRVNRWMSRRLSRMTGRELPDTQCGFRLVEIGSWSKLELRAQRFEVESEYLVTFLEAGLSVEFVPIQVIYKTERSKIHPLRDTVRWFRWLRTRRRRE